MVHEVIGESIFPKFEAGKVFRQTARFRIVMDYKLGFGDNEEDQRFYIEPLTDDAEQMLKDAAEKHNVFSVNERAVNFGPNTTRRACLRADFILENMASLFFGVTQIPKEGEDSIPSPDRMEECLTFHPDSYTFGELKTFDYQGQTRPVRYIETIGVKAGVECDTYSFRGDNTMDLGVIRINEDGKTPLQKVLQGEKTVEGFISGKGQLVVTPHDGNSRVYPVDEYTEKPFSVTVAVGETMQWQADPEFPLVAYEICVPPYKDGRFENL